MSDHAEIESSIAAFVLGALSEDERRDVAAHLESCADCRLVAGRLQRAAGALPLATTVIQPPAHLRSRIVAGALASRRDREERPRRVTFRPALRPERLTARWARPLAQSISRALVPALAIAVVGLAIWNISLSNQLHNPSPGSALASTTLEGRGDLTGAQATVVDFKGQSVALVTFSHMPAPPPGKLYQLWLIPATGSPESVGVFVPDSDGSKAIVVTRDIGAYKLIGVTTENAPSGAAAPTQTPSLAGNTV